MTITPRPAALAACTAAVVALTGCSDDPEVTEDPSPQPATTVDQSAATGEPDDPDADPAGAAREYLDAIATNDPTVMREALDLTADGSTAFAYLMFQITRAEALLDGGVPFIDMAGEVNPTGDGLELCDAESTCTLFAGFEHTDGQLTDFTVDGEEPGPRLTLGNGQTVESNGVSAEFLVAYRAITQDLLLVTARLETTDDTTASPFLYDATYRALDGAQRTATDAYGPTDLGASSHTTIGVIFDRVETGGDVTLDGCVNDCSGDFTITLQVG